VSAVDELVSTAATARVRHNLGWLDLKRLARRLVQGTAVFPFEDSACLAAAERIQRDRPHWLVTWGTHSRLFWAHPTFTHRHDLLASAGTPEELIARMDATERLWRAQNAQLVFAPRQPEQEAARNADRT
jgi:hypothetical protein